MSLDKHKQSIDIINQDLERLTRKKFKYYKVHLPQPLKDGLTLYSVRLLIRLLISDKPLGFIPTLYSMIMSMVTIWGVFTVLIESTPQYFLEDFFIQELIIAIFFTVDLALRAFSYPVMKTLTSPLTYCDLLAIIPTWISLFATQTENVDLRFLRAFRVLRVMRVFRVAALSEQLAAMAKGLKLAWKVLLLVVFTTIVYAFIFGTLMWFAEMTQAEFIFEPAEGLNRWTYTQNHFGVGKPAGTITVLQSIPQCMYWAAVTLFTIGYGDTYPVSPTGKVVGWFAIVVGSFFIAVPMGLYGEKMNEGEKLQMLKTKIRVASHVHANEGYKGRLGQLEESLDQLTARAEEVERMAKETKHHIQVIRSSIGNMRNIRNLQ